MGLKHDMGYLGGQSPRAPEEGVEGALMKAAIKKRRLGRVGEPVRLGRFELRGQLGRGATGTVYEAIDTRDGSPVALKHLDGLGARGIVRLKQEFRSLADVSHANLLHLHELFNEQGRWFLTMELVEGVTFLSHVRQQRSGCGLLCELRLRDALSQLVDGILSIHQAGKLHRDLKPSNVLVTHEGRVVVLDFGLVCDRAPRESQSQRLVGTPAYMAPEQVVGDPATEASDWYSVGVMLYRALTGELPFKGSALEQLRKKCYEQPVAPSELCAVPPEVEALCLSLLSTHPGDRPCGRELLRWLGRTTPAPPPPGSSPWPPAPEPERYNHEALPALAKALGDTRKGRPVTVLLTGPARDKTALGSAFAEQLRGEAVVLFGRCDPRESVPFRAFDQVIDELGKYLRGLPTLEAAALLPRHPGALASTFPALRSVPAIRRARRRETLPYEGAELRRLAIRSLRDLLGRVAARVPMVVMVDDLHWGDSESAHLLQCLLDSPDAPAILFVGCCTEGETRRGLFFGTLGAAGLPGPVRVIEV